jgi:RimJ/RimL family protein N-acetyltransferase
MGELLRWLKKKKIKDVNVGVFIKNKPSIKLNEKFGFKPITINMWRRLK